MSINTNIYLPKYRYITSTQKTGCVKVRIIPIKRKEKAKTDIGVEE